MIETFLSNEGGPQTLLAFSRAGPMGGLLAVQILSSGAILLVDEVGSDVRHTALTHDLDGCNEPVRVSYAWDVPVGTGRLTLADPASGRIRAVPTPAPHPVATGDLQRMTQYPASRVMDRHVGFVAVSDRIEPIGPMPTLTADAPIATPRGEVRPDSSGAAIPC